MAKYKKILMIIGISIASLLILIIAFISPLSKYLVEKYDVEFTGREITMDWAYLNPFTGYIHFDNLVIFEYKSDSIFFEAKGLSANLAMTKLFSKTYEISEISLNKPIGKVIHYKNDFNFTDVIEKFSSDEPDEEPENPIRFNMLDIEVIDGEFHYKESKGSVNYFIKNVDITSKGLRYDVDSLVVDISFLSGLGEGKIGGEFVMNLDNLDYKIAAKVERLDLIVIKQYLKDLTNYGTFTAMLDGDMTSFGNFGEVDSLSIYGYLTVSDFHFGKNTFEDYASFDNFTIAIEKLSLKDKVYNYDSISLSKPFFNYELYDNLDNIQTMFGKSGGNVASANAASDEFNLVIGIAKLVRSLSQNFFSSNYRLEHFGIYNGNMQFSDYTLGEKFTIALNPLTVIADSVYKTKDRVYLNVKSGIKPYGELRVALNIDPKDSSYFDLNYSFQQIPLPMFNSYTTKYTSFPMDRGALELVGRWNVKDGVIKSNNHLIVFDPRISKRVKNNDTKWLPFRFAMFFIRDRGNIIDYEIPIQGRLDDPHFKFRDIIFDIAKNIFVKPMTSPYRTELKHVEQRLEKALTMKWESNECKLSKSQKKFIEKMISFLKDNPTAKITIKPKLYDLKEKEHILLFEAKKRYFLASAKINIHSFTESDSFIVAKMSIKDVNFVKYLNKKVTDPTLFTVHHKAEKLISQSLVNSKFNKLNNARKKAFMLVFKEKNVDKQVRFKENVHVIPFNGFSFYSISYQGEFPDYLKESSEKMSLLNGERPRDEYQKKRKKNTISRLNIFQ